MSGNHKQNTDIIQEQLVAFWEPLVGQHERYLEGGLEGQIMSIPFG